jgi:hypothetical protein
MVIFRLRADRIILIILSLHVLSKDPGRGLLLADPACSEPRSLLSFEPERDCRADSVICPVTRAMAASSAMKDLTTADREPASTISVPTDTI